jgi:hypothetical protein
MGADVIEKILPGLPLIIAQEAAMWAVVAIVSIAIIRIFC